MSLSAGNTVAESVTLDHTAVAAMSTGAYTVAILCKVSANSGLWNAAAGGFSKRETHRFDGNLFAAPTDFSSGYPGVTNDTWTWIVQSKPAGSAHPRWHVADLATLTWSHGESTGAANLADSSATDQLTVGFPVGYDSYTKWNGDWAAFAVWTSELSDSAIAAALTRAANDAFNATPGLLVLAPEATAGSALTDEMSGSGETARTAGWTASADPPSFNFTIGDDPGGEPGTPGEVRVRIAGAWVTISSGSSGTPTQYFVWTGTEYALASGAASYVGTDDPADTLTVADGSWWIDTATPALNVREAGAWVAI